MGLLQNCSWQIMSMFHNWQNAQKPVDRGVYWAQALLKDDVPPSCHCSRRPSLWTKQSPNYVCFTISYLVIFYFWMRRKPNLNNNINWQHCFMFIRFNGIVYWICRSFLAYSVALELPKLAWILLDASWDFAIASLRWCYFLCCVCNKHFACSRHFPSVLFKWNTFVCVFPMHITLIINLYVEFGEL